MISLRAAASILVLALLLLPGSAAPAPVGSAADLLRETACDLVPGAEGCEAWIQRHAERSNDHTIPTAQAQAGGLVLTLLATLDGDNDFDATVVADRVEDGARAWQVPLSSDAETLAGEGHDLPYGLLASPDGSTVYVVLLLESPEINELGAWMVAGPDRVEGRVLRLVALDVATGERRWKSDTPVYVPYDLDVLLPALRQQQAVYPWSFTLSADGARLVVAGRTTSSTLVLAYDTAQGERRWTRSVPEVGTPRLAAAGDAVLLATGGGLRGLAAADGVQRWHLPLAPTPRSLAVSGALAHVHGIEVVQRDGEWRVDAVAHGIDPATGALAWTTRFEAGDPDAVMTAQADRVVLGVRSQSGPAAIALDAATGAHAWNATLPAGLWTHILLAPAPGHVLAVSSPWQASAYAVTALDLATGETAWTRSHPTPGQVGVAAVTGGPTPSVALSVFDLRGTSAHAARLDAEAGDVAWTTRDSIPFDVLDRLHAILVSPDGATAYAVGNSRLGGDRVAIGFTVLAHDVQTGERRYLAQLLEDPEGGANMGHVTSAALSQDGSVLYVTGELDGFWGGPGGGGPLPHTVAAFATSDGSLLWSVLREADGIDVDPLGDGVLATSSHAWSTARTILEAYDADGASLWRTEFANATTHDATGTTAVSPDGSRAFVAMRKPGAEKALLLASVDTANGQTRWETSLTVAPSADHFTTDVAVSPDGRFVLVTGGYGSRATAIAFDAQTGAHAWSALDASSSFATGRALAFSPDGTRFAVAYDGSGGGYVAVRDAATGAALWRSGSPVEDVAWTPEGDRILTAGRAGAVQVHDAHTGERLARYLVRDAHLAAVATTSTHLLVGGVTWPSGARDRPVDHDMLLAAYAR